MITVLTGETPEAFTWEDVPMKITFPKHLRTGLRRNLWSVPSHKKCNQRWREREMYFYAVLFNIVQRDNPEMGKELLHDIERQVRTGWTMRKLFQEMLNRFIESDDCPDVGHFVPDHGILSLVGLKVARGVFYLENDQHAPLENCEGDLYLTENKVPSRFDDTSEGWKKNAVMEEVFSYSTRCEKDEQLMRLRFWRTISFCAAVKI